MNEGKDSIDLFFEEWKSQGLELPGLTLEIQFVYRMARISKFLGQRLDETLTGHDLTRSQFEALAALRRKHPQPLCAQDLMEASLLTSGSVTSMINQLLAEGLVERELSSGDRRRIEIRLTRKGMKTVETALRERVKDNARLAQLLSGQERRELNHLTRRLLAALERENAKKGREL